MDFATNSDDTQLNALIDQHLPELIGRACRLTGSRTEADDLVQDAILRAWRYRAQFETGTNGRAWLHRILMNTFINGYRRKRRETDVLAQVGVELDEDTMPIGLSDTAVGDEVELALAELPEEFRAVIVRVDVDEQSYREVADELGCPIGTVMSRLHRARRVLKSRLRGYAASEGYASEAA